MEEDNYLDLNKYLTELYLEDEKGLTYFIIDAYNKFVDRLPRMFEADEFTIEENSKTYKLQFSHYILPSVNSYLRSSGVEVKNRKLKFEPMFPNMARQSQGNYMANLMMNVVETSSGDITKEPFELLQVPSMLRSKLCNLANPEYFKFRDQDGNTFYDPAYLEKIKGELEGDPGGYFVMAGHEKVILFQSRLVFGKPLVYSSKNGFSANLTIKTDTFSKIVAINQSKKGVIVVNYDRHKTVNKDAPGINIAVAFAALGYKNENLWKLLEMMKPNHLPESFMNDVISILSPSVSEAKESKLFSDREKFLEFIFNNDSSVSEQQGDKWKIIAFQNLVEDLFPHVSTIRTHQENKYIFAKKAQMLAIMLLRLIAVIKEYENPDDRNIYPNIQYQLPSVALEKLIQQYWKGAKFEIQRKLQAMKKVISVEEVKNQIFHYMRGTLKFNTEIVKNFIHLWGVSSNIQTGVTEILNRDANNISIYAQLTRIHNSTRSRMGKKKGAVPIAPRLIQPTQIGYACLFESPDSEKIGETRNAGWLNRVTLDTDIQSVLESLEEILLGKITAFDDLVNKKTSHGIFFFNGDPQGWCDIQEIFYTVRDARRRGDIIEKILVNISQKKGVLYDDNHHPAIAIGTISEDDEIEFSPEYANEYFLDDEGNVRNWKPYFQLGLGIERGNLHINCTPGRAYVPRVILYPTDEEELEYDEGKIIKVGGVRSKSLLNQTWGQLLANGAIEYIDALELGQCVIASRIVQFQGGNEMISNYYENISRLVKEIEYEEDLDIKNDKITERDRLVVQLERIMKENKYTHFEIDPNVILGIAATTIPAIQQTQTPRLGIQCKMVSQGTTVLPDNIKVYYGPKIRSLTHSNFPLFRTSGGERVGYETQGAGQMAIIAFISDESNQEDSLILNQASVDVGMYRQIAYFPYSIKEYADSSLRQVLFSPIPEPGQPLDMYDHLDFNGVVDEGVEVKEGQILVCLATYATGNNKAQDFINIRKDMIVIEERVQVYQFGRYYLKNGDKIMKRNRRNYEAIVPELEVVPSVDEIPYDFVNFDKYLKIDEKKYNIKSDNILDKIELVIQESLKEIEEKKLEMWKIDKKDRPHFKDSLRVKPESGGVVDGVAIYEKESKERLINIRIRQMRKPDMANKFDSRFGQKAVVGEIKKKVDMPFTDSGIIPDIIINSLCLPARMTISWVIELLTGKIDALGGVRTNADAFRPVDEVSVMEELKKYGFNRHGWETMNSGTHGTPLEAQIYIGPSFISTLKHMVDDKIQTRGSGGRRDFATGQISKGRSAQGGLRFGHMEVDAALAHGATAFINDRLMEVSDGYELVVCLKCGISPNFQAATASFKCPRCKLNDFGKIKIPFSLTLITRSLLLHNIMFKFNFKTGKKKTSIENEEGDILAEDEEDEDEDEEEEDEEEEEDYDEIYDESEE